MAEEGDMTPAGAAAPTAAQRNRQTYRSAGHSQGLLAGLLALRQSGVLFDVTLLVEGRPIPAHRILLAASCDYFRGMFAGGLREMRESEIPVHGVTYMAMAKLLDFIYTAELELNLDNVQEILCAASLLQIQDVMGFCCDFLFSWLDDENVLEVHKLAETYGLEQLGAKVHSFLSWNIQAFSRTAAYRQLPPETVFRVLSSDDLEVNSENEVYEAALHYHYSPEEVETDQVCLQDPMGMLEAVRFCLMEHPALQRLHERLHPCLLRDRVAAALHYHTQELWQPVLQGPLTQPRSRLRCLLGFGGMYCQGPVARGDSFYAFHPSWGEWKAITAPQAPRMSNQGIAVLNNFVYLIGGDKNTNSFRAEARCWRYDPRHNTWCTIKSLMQQHADHCVCVVGGFIYTIGGRDYSTELECVERYDPRINAWEYVAPLKREVYAHAGAVVGEKIYVSCGRRGMTYLKETYCYDPETDQWAACAEGPVERAWHGMVAVNGRAYVIGGSNDERGYRRDVLKVACYHVSSNEWSLVSPLPAGHGEPGMGVLEGLIYILGGRSHDKHSRMRHVHVYDPAVDRWETGVSLQERVSGLAACELLLPRWLVSQACSWEQFAKATWHEADSDNSDNSSND